MSIKKHYHYTDVFDNGGGDGQAMNVCNNKQIEYMEVEKKLQRIKEYDNKDEEYSSEIKRLSESLQSIKRVIDKDNKEKRENTKDDERRENEEEAKMSILGRKRKTRTFNVMGEMEQAQVVKRETA